MDFLVPAAGAVDVTAGAGESGAAAGGGAAGCAGGVVGVCVGVCVLSSCGFIFIPY